jgi:hypothetical protein
VSDQIVAELHETHRICRYSGRRSEAFSGGVGPAPAALLGRTLVLKSGDPEGNCGEPNSFYGKERVKGLSLNATVSTKTPTIGPFRPTRGTIFRWGVDSADSIRARGLPAGSQGRMYDCNLPRNLRSWNALANRGASMCESMGLCWCKKVGSLWKTTLIEVALSGCCDRCAVR